MKLNYKRTFLIGLAFMSITSFWQLYNPIIPKILLHTFNMSEVNQGIIMALDNILAVILLPVFGSISDKCKLRIGKRMPYIVIGTALAAILIVLLPIADEAKNLSAFVIILLLLLITMGIYRSPAVSLMSDLTTKPLRSKANGVINLMGAVGGVFTLLLMQFFIHTRPDGREDYSTVFTIVACFMLLCITILLLTIREREMASEVGNTEDEPIKNAENKSLSGFKSLGKEERHDLIFILISIFFWFVGYNAIETNFTKFASVKWESSTAQAATCLMIASLGAIVSFIPVGFVATRIGRRKTIKIGIVLLSACFFAAGLFKEFSYIYFILFALVGVAWAFINVNSLPMVVDICHAKDIGKFTGYYYTFSMAAQIVTPILCGLLLDIFGYNILMPYGAIAVAISYFTISQTRLGDSKQ